MTTPKTPTPEEVVTDIFKTFLNFTGTPVNKEEAKPATDNIVEFNRLLAKAEKAAVGHEDEAEILIKIADRHLQLVATVLSNQK